MRLRRWILVALLLLAVLAAAAVLLLPRLRSPEQGSSSPAKPQATSAPTSRAKRSEKTPIPTSEALIAAALKAGEITYEESLLQRAYAIFDDPRQRKEFHSPVINWEAGALLLHEIRVKEPTLSKELLQALAPFRVRPSDPASIVNRPRADVVHAQNNPARWVSYAVPGTEVRLWIQGTEADLEQKYAPMVQRIWSVFAKFFPYPSGDAGRADLLYDTDDLTDIYLIHGNDVDPRNVNCTTHPGTANCVLGTRAGLTPEAPPVRGPGSAGYCLIKVELASDWLLATIAHELAHVTEHNFDNDESSIVGIGEGTASWVEYKVQKELNIDPQPTYAMLDPDQDSDGLFGLLDRELYHPRNGYGSWLFLYSLSRHFTDTVVTRIWQKAGAVGFQGYKAVNEIAPLDEYFPLFTVLNWNKDSVLEKYHDTDVTFPQQLMPTGTFDYESANAGTYPIDQRVASLSAQYYHFTWGEDIRRITLRNFFSNLPEAHIWAIKKTPSGWDVPEDWSRSPLKMLCRATPKEDASELVLIVSNTDMTKELPPSHPTPELILEGVGCETVEGTAQTTLRINDPARNSNLTYVSSIAVLKFRPRTIQDPLKGQQVQNPFTGQATTYPGTGNVEYDLMPTSVIWTVSGIKDGCRVDGKMLVDIPDLIDLPLDPTRPAYGYLNVVSKDGGDFHSVKVMTFNPAARMRKMCPDSDRPQEDVFESAILLSVLSEMNTHNGNAVSYQGQQTFDPDRFEDQLPPAARELLKNMPQVQGALRDRPAGGRLVYTFNWELRPRPPVTGP